MAYIKNNAEQCVGCGQCSLVCEADAILMDRGEAAFDRERCILCETCIAYCPVGALILQEGRMP
jgi:ferredoxin